MLQDPSLECNNLDLDDLQDPDAPSSSQECGEFGFDVDTQRAIVAACVRDETLAKIIGETLSPQAFTQKVHQEIVRIAIEHQKMYGVLPTHKTVMLEIKAKFADDKALPLYLGECDVVCEYVYEVHSLGYLRDKVKEFARLDLGKRAVNAWLDSCKKGQPDFEIMRACLRKADSLEKGTVGRRGYFPADLESMPPTKWAVEKHFVCGGFNVLYGPYGVKKTFWALDLAISISLGIPFLGRYATEKTTVCYVTGEGHSGFRKRIYAWCQEHGVSMKDLDSFIIVPYQFNLQEPGEVEALVTLAKEAFGGKMPGLFVFDTLAKMFGNGDSNSSQAMTTYVNNLIQLQEIGKAEGVDVSVLSIAHTGKDQSRGIMGSNVLPGACDTIIRLEDRGKTVSVKFDKQKDSSKDLTYDFASKVVEVPEDLDPSREGTLVISADVAESFEKPQSAEIRTLEVILKNFGVRNFKNRDLVAAGVPSTTASRHIATLVNKGLLIQNKLNYRVHPNSTKQIVATAEEYLHEQEEQIDTIVSSWSPSDSD